MKLYPYQQEAVNKVLELLKCKNKIILQANTGAGKTVMFSYITKQYVNNGRKVLILCHREELVEQTVETLKKFEVSSQEIFPKTKQLKVLTADVYVGMVETIYNRVSKRKFEFDNIGLVIADECHIRVFQKVYPYFNNSKILGVTATPVHTQRIKFWRCNICRDTKYEPFECCNDEAAEWSKPYTFSMDYEDIVVGASMKELISFGQLVEDRSFILNYADLSKLKVDPKTGDFTTKSIDEVYANPEASFNVYKNYNELARGKRTIIFNGSTKSNAMVYQELIANGVNAKMFDSVNETEDTRKDVVEWFRNEPDAVLCNVGVFTAGFDVKEVEAIILNRATDSLSLFLQMVGRGGRGSDKIYKDHFIVIDGGGNINRFGEWSDDRDWRKIFFEGIGKERAKRNDPEDLQDCQECGALFLKSENECPECGAVVEKIIKPKKEIIGEDVARPIRSIPPPDPKRIYEFVKKNNGDIHMALRILQSRIVDLFRYYNVTAEKYERAKQSGELDKKIGKIIRANYFFFLKCKDIQSDAHRTLNYVINKTKEKIEKYYYG